MTIVVGVDGSPGSKAALRWALAEARLRGTALEAVHAWMPPYVAAGLGLAPVIDEEYLRAHREKAEEMLDTVLAEVADEAKGVDVRRVVAEGPAAQVLVERAAGADLLVVGSRGLGGFAGLLLGSVGQQCAHHAPCPVVIVRPHEQG